MKTRFAIMAAALTLPFLAPAHAAGAVEVSYTKSEEFTDAGRGAVDRERTMSQLTEYLQRLARQLPDGQTLRLEFTDIDLAGEIQPFTFPDIRVLRGAADWPHLNLSYSLLEGSRTVKAGEARLSDPAYMFAVRRDSLSDSALASEKRLLKRWFEETFAAVQ